MEPRQTGLVDGYLERESGVYGFEATYNVAHVIVAVGHEDGRTQRVIRVFRLVADAGIPVFLAKLHGHEVSFAVEASRLAEVERALTAAGYSLRTRRDLAIVTIHAGTLQDLTGVMVRIADAFQRAGARMYGSGDSHSSIQCLTDGHRAEPALAQLRSVFGVNVANG